MPAPQYPFTLTPHPAATNPPLTAITGHLTRTRDTLAISYRLAGDIDRLRLPPIKAPHFADELWRHTCCELFIAHRGDAAYHECNFSPSRAWAAYAFARTRERAGQAHQLPLATLDPTIVIERGAHTLELKASVRLDALSPRYTSAALVLALSAVIEDRDGALSYWALAHPRPQPDFHHPDAFVLELDEVRN